jgi:biopolymer transport protein ExbB/TolQ
MFIALLDYLSKSSIITWIVMGLLSLYLVAVTWIFLYRYFSLGSWYRKEKESLEGLLAGESISKFSALYGCAKSKNSFTRELLTACKTKALKKATDGQSFLSIVASTSPFIGLFGTVISILESFAAFGLETKVTLNVIAPAISEALVATASGIFVAIFAYTFHQILKRKSFELMSFVDTQIDIVLSKDTSVNGSKK